MATRRAMADPHSSYLRDSPIRSQRSRNKIGLEVALEALRDRYRQRKATMDELFMAAKVCRVARVMHPYLESLA